MNQNSTASNGGTNSGIYSGRRPSARSLGRKIRAGGGVSDTAKPSASSKKRKVV